MEFLPISSNLLKKLLQNLDFAAQQKTRSRFDLDPTLPCVSWSPQAFPTIKRPKGQRTQQNVAIYACVVDISSFLLMLFSQTGKKVIHRTRSHHPQFYTKFQKVSYHFLMEVVKAHYCLLSYRLSNISYCLVGKLSIPLLSYPYCCTRKEICYKHIPLSLLS